MLRALDSHSTADGKRQFDHFGGERIELERTRAGASPAGVTHKRLGVEP